MTEVRTERVKESDIVGEEAVLSQHTFANGSSISELVDTGNHELLDKRGISDYGWLKPLDDRFPLDRQEVDVLSRAVQSLPSGFGNCGEYVDWCKSCGGEFDQDLVFATFRASAMDSIFSDVSRHHLQIDYLTEAVVGLEEISDTVLVGAIEQLVPSISAYNRERASLRVGAEFFDSYSPDNNSEIVRGDCGFATEFIVEELKSALDGAYSAVHLRLVGLDYRVYSIGADHSIACLQGEKVCVLLDPTIAATGEMPSDVRQDLEITTVPNESLEEYVRLRYAISIGGRVAVE
jgi:hypothetical protein